MGNDSEARLLRIWLLWTLTFSGALLACCFVPQPQQRRYSTVQRHGQSSYQTLSSMYMVSSKKSSVSPVRNNTTPSSNANRRGSAPSKNKAKTKTAPVKNNKLRPQNNNIIQNAEDSLQQENSSLKFATQLEEMHERANKGENLTRE